jgi:hypothetical protein
MVMSLYLDDSGVVVEDRRVDACSRGSARLEQISREQHE